MFLLRDLCEDLFMDFHEILEILFSDLLLGAYVRKVYLKLTVYKLVYFMQFLYICELSAP